MISYFASKPLRKPSVLAERTWTCQRQSKGVVCKHINPKRLQICQACGKKRPPTKRPAHQEIMRTMDYAACVEAFGEICGICGREPPEGKKLHRDHDHHTGKMRGLLCFQCNRQLRTTSTAQWLEAAAAYLRSHQAREELLALPKAPS